MFRFYNAILQITKFLHMKRNVICSMVALQLYLKNILGQNHFEITLKRYERARKKDVFVMKLYLLPLSERVNFQQITQ